MTIDFDTVKSFFTGRPKDAHKGDFGTLSCVCGSRMFSGAAVMSAQSAIKCGVGLVNMIIPSCIHGVVASHLVEPIFTVVGSTESGTVCSKDKDEILGNIKNSSACLIGCGLGNNEDTRGIVYDIISNYNGPIVIDADGINALSVNIDILKAAIGPAIITPHPGEMARLLQKDVDFVNNNRERCAMEFSKNNGVIVVLKGANTVVANENGDVFCNVTGNPGMATAGMGDVLAGMIASFVAQGKEPMMSAITAVYLHGLAGDMCARKLSQISMSATDVIDELPLLFSKF